MRARSTACGAAAVALLAWATLAVRAQIALPAVLDEFARAPLASGFDENSGHLRNLLRALDIPVESQVLVFSGTSLQNERIAPRLPRAIYFNDHAYVAYVAGSPILEVSLVDRETGFAFYQVEQNATAPTPQADSVCQLCHDPARTGVSRLIMRSHYTDANGRALQQRGQMDQLLFETTDRSPFERRWGGWYVTGTHGSMRHMGNIHGAIDVSHISDPVGYTRTFDLNAGANVTSIASLVEHEPYLTLESDIVALLVLGHQVTVENEVVSVMHALRGSGTSAPPAATVDRDAAVERLVAALTFGGARSLPAAVNGTTDFWRVFEAGGVRDSRNRSLRELDLESRLFKYPVSYMLYSSSFNGLPPAVVEDVYRGIAAALVEPMPGYSDDIRRDAVEILRATKPDMASYLGAMR